MERMIPCALLTGNLKSTLTTVRLFRESSRQSIYFSSLGGLLFFLSDYLDAPNVKSLIPYQISQDQIAADLRDDYQQLDSVLKAVGFDSARTYQIDYPRFGRRLVLLYYSVHQNILLRAQLYRDLSSEVSNQKAFFTLTLISSFQNQSFHVTTNSAEEPFFQETIEINQYVGADVDQLLQLHRRTCDLQRADPILDGATCQQINETLHSQVCRVLQEEKVFLPHDLTSNSKTNASVISPSQPNTHFSSQKPEVVDTGVIVDAEVLEHSDGGASSQTGALSVGSLSNQSEMAGYVPARPINAYRPVLYAIDAIENTKTTTKSVITFLLLSIGAFVVAGYFAWDLRLLLFLIPILLVHELGHFVAMKFFNYQNVRMFFVPLLGAAVAGRNYNVAGWKKVLVYLAGPLPGIFLAIPMAITCPFLNIPLLRELTLLVVAINVFNLLPFVPLDGGWVMQSLYFCRNPWVDGITRALAGLALIAGGLMIGAWFLGIFGALIAFNAPTVFKNGKIAQTIKKQFPNGVQHHRQSVALEDSTQPQSSQLISELTACAIIDHLPTEGPQATPKRLAQRTLQIYEIINARAPGFAATIGLTLLYFLSWVVGAVAIAILLVRPTAWLDSHTSEFFSVTENDFQLNIHVPPAFTDQTAKFDQQVLVIGEFATSLEAQTWVKQQQALSSPERVLRKIAVSRVGRTVWISLANQKENTADLELALTAADAQVSIFNARDVWFTFDTESKVWPEPVKEELVLLNQYADQTFALIPSWSPLHSLTPQQIKARKTIVKVLALEDRMHLDDRIEALDRDYQTRLEDNEFSPQQQEQNSRQFTKDFDKIRRAIINKLKSDDAYDEKIIDHYFLQGEISTDSVNFTSVFSGEGNEKQIEAMQAAAVRQFAQSKAWNIRMIEMLGAVAVDPQTQIASFDDRRFSSQGGYIDSFDDEFGQIDNMYFAHPVDGLPVFLLWLQQQGVDNVRFSYSGYSRPLEEER